jgi:hypothetical protein
MLRKVKLVLVLSLCLSGLVMSKSIPMSISQKFEEWKILHGKNYTKEEHWKKLDIFFENWKFVERVNEMKLGYTLETNKFSDMTAEEFGSLTGASEKP